MLIVRPCHVTNPIIKDTSMDFFTSPDRLWHLTWLLPLFAVIFFRAHLKQKHAVKTWFGDPHFADRQNNPIGVNVSHTKRWLKYICLNGVILFAIMAYAQPTWGKKVIPITNAGRDIIIALDLSKSMLAKDIQPNRLAQAKLLISEVTQNMKGDRFGLVSFAGVAAMVCPLTFDRVSFMHILKSQDVNTIPRGGTDLEAALKLCAKHLANTIPTQRAILLITDGGELTGSLLREAEELKKLKMPVVVVGIGDPLIASPIQIQREDGSFRFVEDENKEVVKTKLEETPLRELARATAGVYIHSTLADLGDKKVIHYLEALTPSAQEESSRTLPIERGQWFLSIAFIFLFLYLLLGETQKNPPIQSFYTQFFNSKVSLLILFLLLSSTLSAQESDSIPEYTYNTGLKFQKEQQLDSARTAYEKILSKADLQLPLESALFHNYGTLFHQNARHDFLDAQLSKNKPDQALKSVKQAEKNLALASDFYKEALANGSAELPKIAQNQRAQLQDLIALEKLKKELEALKKQQDQQQNQQDRKDQDKQKDQQEQQKQQEQDKQKQNKDENQQDQQDQNEQDKSQQKDQNEKDLGQQEGQEQAEEKDKKQGHSDGNQEEKLTDDAAEAILREMTQDEEDARKKIIKHNQAKEPNVLKDY